MADIINQEALYRAGAASKSQGRNMEAESHNAMMATIVEGVGGFLENQVTQQLKNHQEFKKQGLNQINDTLAKFNPAEVGINSHMETTVNELHDEYARLIRQKDTKGAQKIFSQLADLDKFVKMYRSGTSDSKEKSSNATGINPKAGTGKVGNAGNLIAATNNQAEQANGRMDALLRWDVNGNNGKGGMYVIRGGQWEKNNGTDYYANIGDRNAFDLNDKRNWFRYEDMDFGMDRDDFLSDLIGGVEKDLLKNSTNSNYHLNWAVYKESLRKEINGAFNDSEVNDKRFMQYFFGGLTHEYSDTSISETSPAYLWMEENHSKKMSDPETGETIWEEGFEPGSKYWLIELESLKKSVRDSGGPGSEFRKKAAEITYNSLVNTYENSQKNYSKNKEAELLEKQKQGNSSSSGGSSGVTYAQALAKRNLETAVSNINSTYTEVLKMDKTDDKEKRIDSGKQGTYVKLNKDKSGKWLWYGYVNSKLPEDDVQTWPMGTGGKPDPSMVNWLTNSQVMSVSGTTGSAGSLD